MLSHKGWASRLITTNLKTICGNIEVHQSYAIEPKTWIQEGGIQIISIENRGWLPVSNIRIGSVYFGRSGTAGLILLRWLPWWRHQMETFSALLAFCAGNSPVTGEIPAQRPVTRSFDVFFDLRLNKRLSKQCRCRWSKTPSRPLWRHCNVQVIERDKLELKHGKVMISIDFCDIQLLILAITSVVQLNPCWSSAWIR